MTPDNADRNFVTQGLRAAFGGKVTCNNYDSNCPFKGKNGHCAFPGAVNSVTARECVPYSKMAPEAIALLRR